MKDLAKVGAGLFIVALVLTYLQLTTYALICLLIIGIIDIFLERKRKDGYQTISQWIHSLFPKKVDVGILIGLLVFTWWVFGPAGFLPVCIGAICGHFFWQENQD